MWHKFLEGLVTKALKGGWEIVFQAETRLWSHAADCYRRSMKAKTNTQECSVSEPLLEAIKGRDIANRAANFPAPSISSEPLAQPALYQDPGSGFNKNFTFPQD